MILLDTNVLSEPLKPAPVESVVNWLDAQSIKTLWISVLTIAELEYGIQRLKDGTRKETLSKYIHGTLLPRFASRTLQVNSQVSLAYATLQANLSRQGKPMPVMDGLIAATAICHKLMLATRNTQDFTHAGIKLIDPWDVAPT